MEIITRNEKILYIGIDVHKDTYSLCCFDFFRNEISDEMTVKATTKAVIKYLEAIKKKHREEILFACGYEAGPTGYRLCRGLQKAGFGCAVMAPTTMSNPDGKKRVKTGRIDARAIARILAYKSYSQVHLPGEEMEVKSTKKWRKKNRSTSRWSLCWNRNDARISNFQTGDKVCHNYLKSFRIWKLECL